MRLFPLVIPQLQNLRELDERLIKEADRNRISLSSLKVLPLFFETKLAYQVVSFTFYCELTSDQFAEVTRLTRLRLLNVDKPVIGDFAFLIFGTLADWLEAIEIVCYDKMRSIHLRFMFNEINNYFVSLGLQEFRVIDCKDGTYIVKEIN